MRQRIHRAFLLAALLSGLVAAPEAWAAITYPEPEKISTAGRSASRPQVVVGADNRAFVAWLRYDGQTSRLQGRWIEPNGDLGPVQYLRSAAKNVMGFDLVIDVGGRVTALWTTDYPDDPIVQSRRILPDGSLEPIQTITDPGQESQSVALAVVDSSDRVTAVWNDGATDRIVSARLAADGTPGSETPLSPAGQQNFAAEVAIDPAGRVFVIWGRYDVEPDTLSGRRIEADRTLGPIKMIDNNFDGNANGTIHAISADTAVVIWSCCNDGGNDRRIRSRTFSGDGTLGPVSNVSAAGTRVPYFSSDYDNTDHGTVAWQRPDGNGGTELVARRLDADGANSSPVRLLGPTVGTNREPGVVIDSLARSTIVWPDADSERMLAVRMLPDGTRGPVRSFGDDVEYLEHSTVAIGPDNRPAVVYPATEDTDSRIRYTRATLTAPETTITSGPTDGSTTPELTPTFEFSSNADSATFDCSSDGGPFVSCGSPTTLPGLSEGAHSFAVRATDDDGTDASPAIVNFTYDPNADPPDTKVEGRQVKASKTQKQKGKRIEIKIKAGADEDVTAKVTGTVDPKGKGHSIDLQKIKAKPVDAGDLRKFILSPRESKDEKKLVKSLKKDGAAKAKLKVELVDTAGNDTSKSVSVKVTN